MAAGCAIDALGGREKCWAAAEARAASLWRGVLTIDAAGARLATPEGDLIPLLPGGEIGYRIATGELLHGSETVARSGDDVTLFGGAGSDGALKVCGVDERH